jgi:hypothetical protein
MPHLQAIAHGGLDLLRMESHRTVADDAADRPTRPRDGRAEGLRHARAEHAELEGREQRVGHAHLVEEHGPHCRVAAVGHQRRALGEHLLAHVRDVRRIHRHREVLQLLVQLRALGADRLVVFRDLAPARIEVHARRAAFELGRERRQEQLHVGQHGEIGRLVGAEHMAVDVDLDRLLLRGVPPVRRLAPPVRLADARA